MQQRGTPPLHTRGNRAVPANESPRYDNHREPESRVLAQDSSARVENFMQTNSETFESEIAAASDEIKARFIVTSIDHDRSEEYARYFLLYNFHSYFQFLESLVGVDRGVC